MPALFRLTPFSTHPCALHSLPPFLHARVWCNPLQRAVNPCLHKPYLSLSSPLGAAPGSWTVGTHRDIIKLRLTLCSTANNMTVPVSNSGGRYTIRRPHFKTEYVLTGKQVCLTPNVPLNLAEKFILILNPKDTNTAFFPMIYYARVNYVIVQWGGPGKVGK